MLKVFRQLQGAWTFERTIANYLNPLCSGAVTGNAEFIPMNEFEYLFHEAGKFITTNDKITIHNEYIYRFHPTEQTIIVYSSQNKAIANHLFTLNFLFHKNDTLSSTCEHQCAADSYTAQYNISCIDDIHSLQLLMTVQGPNKHYKAITTFKQRAS